MLTRKQIDAILTTYNTPTAKIQETDKKILVWDSEFVFEANKLGEFWYIIQQRR